MVSLGQFGVSQLGNNLFSQAEQHVFYHIMTFICKCSISRTFKNIHSSNLTIKGAPVYPVIELRRVSQVLNALVSLTFTFIHSADIFIQSNVQNVQIADGKVIQITKRICKDYFVQALVGNQNDILQPKGHIRSGVKRI